MSSGFRAKDFSQLIRRSSKYLISEKFYDAMDMESDDLQDYDKSCSIIKVNKKAIEMKPICKKYLRFLDKSKLWGDVESGYDVSLLLNYWLYEKLIDIYGDKSNHDIMLGFTDLQMKWGYSKYNRDGEPYYQKCMPDPSKVNYDDWKNRKKLYDYYVDYNELVYMAQNHDRDCKYYQKTKEIISLCGQLENECLPEKNCPDFYDQCKPYKSDNLLPSLQCHDRMQNQIADEETPEQSAEDDRAVSGFQEASASAQGTQPTPESSDIGTKVTNSVLGAAPVLLTATMLYRVPGFAGSVEVEQIV
ncbi:unnamed protein product [Plasmodium vivax]|uniref:(malaria parasite P. vivax) hypothetical protein n=1 Tax=Plasmodium vivax TaxID=5855 RepID=A0A8S4HDB6_PLAVI|nr:unnamed protein product [Plasmodium vivax]